MITLPGLIDMHVHLRDPGQTEKEDFSTGTQAARAGGFAIVADMPNNTLPIFTHERLQEKIKMAKEKAHCTVLFYFGTIGDNLKEFKKVYSSVAGLKVYLDNTTGGYILSTEKLLSVFKAWKSKKPILVHCENEHINTLIDVIRKTKKQTHVCHIHSRVVLEAIMAAKREKLIITCGVTPHHLFLTSKDVKRLGSFGMMKPPLMQKKDVLYLWKHLDDIDVIESDHAPHTKKEKECTTPPFGVPGLETTLPLLLTAVSEGRMTIEDIKRLCYEGPRRILHIEAINTGTIYIDMGIRYTIRGKNMHTKCKWTPFEGRMVKGKIVKRVN
ncbi:MAG: amidohydrolase family protein [bacterium]